MPLNISQACSRCFESVERLRYASFQQICILLYESAERKPGWRFSACCHFSRLDSHMVMTFATLNNPTLGSTFSSQDIYCRPQWFHVKFHFRKVSEQMKFRRCFRCCALIVIKVKIWKCILFVWIEKCVDKCCVQLNKSKKIILEH